MRITYLPSNASDETIISFDKQGALYLPVLDMPMQAFNTNGMSFRCRDRHYRVSNTWSWIFQFLWISFFFQSTLFAALLPECAPACGTLLRFEILPCFAGHLASTTTRSQVEMRIWIQKLPQRLTRFNGCTSLKSQIIMTIGISLQGIVWWGWPSVKEPKHLLLCKKGQNVTTMVVNT